MSNVKRESGWYWVDDMNLDIWEPMYYNANHSDDQGAWNVHGTGWILDEFVDFKIDERKIEKNK
jgi:hypothetical protein